MKVITVCLLIVNLTLWYVECAPPEDDDIYTVDMTECKGTRMKFGAAMMEARCKPRETVVTLPPKIGVSYMPNVVSVKRCGGFCSDGLSCTPSETRIREFVVKSIGNFPNENTNCHRVYVKEHLRCRGACMVMKHHCNKHQRYNKNRCSCECMDRWKESACKLQKNMVWQPETCKCTCVEPEEECPTGLERIPSLCKCAKVM